MSINLLINNLSCIKYFQIGFVNHFKSSAMEEDLCNKERSVNLNNFCGCTLAQSVICFGIPLHLSTKKSNLQ